MLWSVDNILPYPVPSTAFDGAGLPQPTLSIGTSRLSEIITPLVPVRDAENVASGVGVIVPVPNKK